MTKVSDIIAAIDAEGSSSWQIADAIAALDEPLTLQQIADRIWTELGVEWSPLTLGRYRATAIAFPIDTRVSLPTQTFTIARELRAHPDKLRNWKPAKPGDILTVERARALRGGGSGGKTKPDDWKQQVNRALSVIDNVADNDPAWVIDALAQTIATLERRYPKKTRRDLRAV
jgi:hypothetical protein